MANTSPSLVQNILDTDLTDTQIDAFIDAANLVIADKISGDYTASELEVIETWLAAHLCSMRDQRVSKESVGDISVTYQGETGLGLDATSYGQQVKVLDTKNKLSRLGKRDIPTADWSVGGRE